MTDILLDKAPPFWLDSVTDPMCGIYTHGSIRDPCALCSTSNANLQHDLPGAVPVCSISGLQHGKYAASRVQGQVRTLNAKPTSPRHAESDLDPHGRVPRK